MPQATMPRAWESLGSSPRDVGAEERARPVARPGTMARAKPETERGNRSALMNSEARRHGRPRLRLATRGTSPPLCGARKKRQPYPAMAMGTALLLGIWISISSVDMVSPRSIETCR